MATDSFADELREGYQRVAHCLTEDERSVISRGRDPINTRGLERNRLLAQVVCAYRTGRKEVWGPAVLDLMAPTLVVLLQGLRPVPPVIDEREIRQQLVAETLLAAACVAIRNGGYQTRYRLSSRIYTRMLRWLGREGRRRRLQVGLDTFGESL